MGRSLPRELALTLLGSMLDDRAIEVRLAAARTLLALGVRDRALEELGKALADERDDPRLQAAIDLIRFDDPRGLEALAELTRGPSPSTRAAAIRAHSYARRPTPALVAALADESPPLRIEAAETLLRILR
jgi:HEAT repeat protein